VVYDKNPDNNVIITENNSIIIDGKEYSLEEIVAG
jgi:hypothetical protein